MWRVVFAIQHWMAFLIVTYAGFIGVDKNIYVLVWAALIADCIILWFAIPNTIGNRRFSNFVKFMTRGMYEPKYVSRFS